MPKENTQKKPNGNDSGLCFEAQLWAAAYLLRINSLCTSSRMTLRM